MTIDESNSTFVQPDTTIAIDPGDRFCGVAFFDSESMECYATMLYDDEHDTLYGNLVHWLRLRLVRRIVAEDFNLYPDKMQQQGYSKMLTARALGVIEYLAGLAEVEYVEQGASVKKPTRAIMKARGVAHVGTVVHTKDAELHGYYYFHHQAG